MNLTRQYQYRPLERITQPNGVRHYLCPESGWYLPSVTTLLGATANKQALIEWRRRVGDRKADQISQEAVALGSLMHTHLERHILGEPRPGGNNYIRLLAQGMADQIIQRGLIHVDEVFGSEVGLYYPRLYAGTADLVGCYKGRPAIMDFKTAKKLRRREIIEDYFLQLCAYAIAHNEMHGTDIQTGVIFMVTRDGDYEEFVIESDEFAAYKAQFFVRFERFLQQAPLAK